MKSYLDFSDTAYVRLTGFRMVMFFAGYVAVYKVLRKKVGISPEHNCRILTLIHGLLACWAALKYVVLPSIRQNDIIIPSNLILTHSMGYFMFDLIWCLVHGETWVMLFHHFLTVIGLFYYSFKISKQFFIVYALGLTEVTNPILQIRWFLKHHGMREGILFKIVEAILIILFFIIRVVVLSYYMYESWFNEALGMNGDDLAFVTLGCLTGYALSIQMFNYVVYQLKKSKKKKELKEQ